MGTMSFIAANLRVTPLEDDCNIDERKLVDNVAQRDMHSSVKRLSLGIFCLDRIYLLECLTCCTVEHSTVHSTSGFFELAVEHSHDDMMTGKESVDFLIYSILLCAQFTGESRVSSRLFSLPPPPRFQFYHTLLLSTFLNSSASEEKCRLFSIVLSSGLVHRFFWDILSPMDRDFTGKPIQNSYIGP